MAVCWRCPECGGTSCEEDLSAAGKPLSCDHCERPVMPADTLCAICEAPNPWRRRDTLHYICGDCGNSQAFHDRRFGAGAAWVS